MICLTKNNRYDKEKLLLGVFTLIIFGYLIYRLDTLKMVTVVYDEFSYWATGAYFAGKDWSGIASCSSYYAYGYGLILTPLFWIFDNPITMYRAAITLNAIFVSISFLLLYDCGRILFKNISKELLILVSFCSLSYPSIIMNSQVAWTECVMTLVILVIIRLCIQLEKKKSLFVCMLFSVFVVYMYMLHQRNIGIVIAASIYILYLFFYKRLKFKDVLIYFGFLLIMFFIHSKLKESLNNNLWKVNVGNAVNMNDYSAQIQVASQIFSFEGIGRFLAALCGRFFYSITSTYGLVLVSLIYLLIKFKDCIIGIIGILYGVIKKRTKNPRDYIQFNGTYLFLFLSFMALISISAISMLNPGRIDTLIYGRYHEFVFPIYILIGFCLFIETKKNYQYTIFNILFIGITALITFMILNSYGVDTVIFNAIPGLFYSFLRMNNYFFVFYAALISIAVIFVITFLIHRNFKQNKYIAILIIFIMNIYISQSVLERVEWMQSSYAKSEETMDILNLLNNDYKIYCLERSENGLDDFAYRTAIIQFLQPDRKVQGLAIEDLDKIERDSILIIENQSRFLANLENNYIIIKSVLNYSILIPNSGGLYDEYTNNKYAL